MLTDMMALVVKSSFFQILFSTKAAITKCHRWGGLNNRNLFFTVLEAGNPKIKVLAVLVSPETSLLGL